MSTRDPLVDAVNDLSMMLAAVRDNLDAVAYRVAVLEQAARRDDDRITNLEGL